MEAASIDDVFKETLTDPVFPGIFVKALLCHRESPQTSPLPWELPAAGPEPPGWDWVAHRARTAGRSGACGTAGCWAASCVFSVHPSPTGCRSCVRV